MNTDEPAKKEPELTDFDPIAVEFVISTVIQGVFGTEGVAWLKGGGLYERVELSVAAFTAEIMLWAKELKERQDGEEGTTGTT